MDKRENVQPVAVTLIIHKHKPVIYHLKSVSCVYKITNTKLKFFFFSQKSSAGHRDLDQSGDYRVRLHERSVHGHLVRRPDYDVNRRGCGKDYSFPF